MKSDRNVPWDLLDRQLLHALELDGRASFSRLADVLGVSDQTVARRYRRLLSDGGLRVVGVPDMARLGVEHWVLRLRCTPDASEAIGRALARRPDTAWITLLSGGTEVICTAQVRDRGDHEELLLGKLPRTPSIVEIRAHQVLRRFWGGPNGWLTKRGCLTPEQVAALTPPPVPGPDGQAWIEPEDEPLVAALEADGRAGLTELQQATGRSEPVLRRRLDRLLGSGALFVDVQYHAGIFGCTVGAWLWITTEPSALDAVGRALAEHPEVAFAAATTGVSNLVACVVFRSTAELYDYLSGVLGKLDGIRHIETSTATRRIKQLKYVGH
jgi:DNA-binding Lrp family transcriptional regulator